MRKIYFDNNATTPLDPEARAVMLPYLDDRFGNPSSGHRFGETAQAGLQPARRQVADLLHCLPASVIFTGGGTEANNTAIWSAITAAPAKKHIIASRVEHDSVLAPLRFLRERFGYEVELLPVDRQGGLDLDVLAGAIRPDTALVSLMGANNETGVIWPLAGIGELCHKEGVLFHCDAVQMVGKEPLDMEELAVDYLAMAAHKLHGPKGVGALYVKRTAPLTPLIMGAGQESGRRAGTENVAGIVGFGKACEIAGRELASCRQRLAGLRQRLEEAILKTIPESVVNGRALPRLANTLNVSFMNCAANGLIQELDERGVAVSAHSACHSGDLDPSHVLTAMGVEESFLHGTLRISLSRFNTEAEVDYFLGILPGLVEKSRQGFV